MVPHHKKMLYIICLGTVYHSGEMLQSPIGSGCVRNLVLPLACKSASLRVSLELLWLCSTLGCDEGQMNSCIVSTWQHRAWLVGSEALSLYDDDNDGADGETHVHSFRYTLPRCSPSSSAVLIQLYFHHGIRGIIFPFILEIINHQ